MTQNKVAPSYTIQSGASLQAQSQSMEKILMNVLEQEITNSIDEEILKKIEIERIKKIKEMAEIWKEL